ncbi:MAG: CoA transferase [Candidatus Lambdaproteobacteria bacterium]|nr:CoA transferase [Candidatus Lambdaproteobacteria bacterium]
MDSGLSGLRVLELGGGVEAAYATKLLADLGAAVIKVEPPEGEPARYRGPFRNGIPDREASGLYLALNANKRSVVADLHTESGQSLLDRLAAWSNVLIHNFAPPEMARLDIGYERFSAGHPALAMVSITPFGLTGPYRDFAAAELTVFHASAAASIIPAPEDPVAQPPVKFFGQQAYIQAGLFAATAALGIHFGSAASGRGDHIDLSVQEVCASTLLPFFMDYAYSRRITERSRPVSLAPAQFYPCRDGFIYISTPQESQWQNLLRLLDDSAWANDPKFATPLSRSNHRDEMNVHLEAWTRRWKTDALFKLLQSRHIAATVLYTHDELLQHPQLRERGFIAEQQHPRAGGVSMPGAPYRLRDPWWALRTPAPLLGEGNAELSDLLADRLAAPRAPQETISATGAGSLPLAGVRVLDLTWFWAGPLCTQLLAYLGAEVIRIESRRKPDFTRHMDNPPLGMQAGPNKSGFFNQINQGKSSVVIDMSQLEGLQLVKRLAAVSDVVASNFSHGVMERFGLGAEDLAQINPRAIALMISGFGQTGDMRTYIAYGQTVIPMGGMLAMPAPGLQPQYPAGSGDPNAGVYSAIAVLASLISRRRTGRGQAIDDALWENMLSNSMERWLNAALGNPPYPYMGNRDPVHAPHNVFPCRGRDQWVAIAVTSDAQWLGLCRAMRRGKLVHDPRFKDPLRRKANEDQLDAIVAAWTRKKERWQVTDQLQRHGVPAFPSMTAQDLLDNAHLKGRGFFTRLRHAEVGVQTHTGAPWRLRHHGGGVTRPAPLLGEHTDVVLRDVLGLGADEVQRLRAAQVVG